MDLGISGKVGLVFGAGGGLGGAIASALCREGVQVAVADLNLDAAMSVAAKIREDGGVAMPIEWDLSATDSFADRLSQVNSKLGPVQILVNNSGGPRPATASNISPEEWMKYFESMVVSLMHITDLVLPQMRDAGWGRIVTSSSSGTLAPIENLGISNTLRSALLAWSKTLSREVARDGITVNVVVPGRIATPRITSLDQQKAARSGSTAAEISALSEASIPIGRYGRPAEYANAVAFLASECASYMTGTVVRVDGGLVPSTF